MAKKKMASRLKFKLSTGDLQKIIRGVEIPKPVFQVISIMKIIGYGPTDRFRLHISDGVHSFVFVMLGKELNHVVAPPGKLDQYSIIRCDKIISGSMGDTKQRILVIPELTVLRRGYQVGGMIGCPTQLNECNEVQVPAPPIPTRNQAVVLTCCKKDKDLGKANLVPAAVVPPSTEPVPGTSSKLASPRVTMDNVPESLPLLNARWLIREVTKPINEVALRKVTIYYGDIICVLTNEDLLTGKAMVKAASGSGTTMETILTVLAGILSDEKAKAAVSQGIPESKPDTVPADKPKKKKRKGKKKKD